MRQRRFSSAAIYTELIGLSITLYDSRDLRCKTPFGAAKTEEIVTFRIFLPISYQLHSPHMLLYKADEWDCPERITMQFDGSDGMQNSYLCSCSTSKPQLYFYLFEVTGVNGIMRISRDADGFGKLTTNGTEMWQLTVYDRKLHTPNFLKSGIMYQIFPDRFFASGRPKQNVPSDRKLHEDWYELPDYLPNEQGEVTNSDYFGGDLAGIAQKLPYLKSLGVSTLYLNPIFEAHSNHRYNTADFEKVDPLLGDEQDFKLLCEQAQAQGIYIILDGVFNHTGSDSVYFNKNKRYGEGGAYHDFHSRYHSWYEFTDFPNYQSWWGFETLPNLNEKDPAYSTFICGENGVLKKWLKLGLSGYRLDVADELPDVFLDQICACIKSHNSQAAVIGEVWEDATTKFAYGVRRRYFLGGQLDSVMNYPFKDAILAYIRYGDCNRLYHTIMDILEHYPKPVLDVLMNSLSTHDVERAITILGGEPVGHNAREWQGQNNFLSPERYAAGKHLFRLAAVIQYLLPGIPCLYYGDEAGLYGYKDPFNRTCYPWGREDLELLATFRKLGAIRTAYPKLSTGAFRAISFTPEYLVFVRDCGEQQIVVAVNRSDKTVTIPLPKEYRAAKIAFGAIDNETLAPLDCVILAC